MNPRQLRDYIPLLPINDLQDDCIASKRGDITFGWRITLPVAHTVNELGYDSIIADFMKAYKLLPPYCIVHKQDIFKYDTYHASKQKEFLADSYEKHHEGTQYLNGYCYLFLTFSSKSVIEMKTQGSGYYKNITARPPKEELIRQCASFASQFEAVLQNNPLIDLQPLKASDFIREGEHGEDCGLVPEYLNLFRRQPAPNYPLEFGAGYIKYDDEVAKVWYVEDSDSYPALVSSVKRVDNLSTGASQVFLSGGSTIGYSLKIPHIVNRYVVTLPRKAVESELKQKQKLMNSFSLYSPSCRINANDIDEYLEAIARDSSTTTIKCFTDLIAWGHPSNMSDIRNSIVTAFSELDMTVAEEMKVAPSLHYAGIPGAAAELGYEFLMTSEMTGFLCHGLWDGYDSGIEGGCITVSDRKRGIPLRIDIQTLARKKNLISDQNILVVGPSGTGKSFTMNQLVKNFYNSDQHIFIVDIGDSYQGICRVINEETGGKDGIYNSYDPNNPLSFNLFNGRSHWGEVDEDGEVMNDGYSFVISVLKTMYSPIEGWSKQYTSALESILNHFFYVWDNGYDSELENNLRQAFVNACRKRAELDGKKKSFSPKKAAASWLNPLPDIFAESKKSREPIFDDFYQFVTLVVGPLINDENYRVDNSNIRKDMFDVDNFGLSLARFAKTGQYGFLLNAETQKDYFASRLTVYEVDKIKDNEDLFPIWLLTIMHEFENKMRTLTCQKVMIIEEAWSAIAKPTMANYIVWLWRTARKFRTSACIVTQSLPDLVSSPIIKDAIIVNTSVRILLDQSKNVNIFDKSAETLGFTALEVSQALSVRKEYHECFFAIGNNFSNVYVIDVSPEEVLVYESEKPKKKPLFDLAKEKGSFIEAVREMADQMRNSKTQN